jgi:hypothetical protein
MTSRLARLPLLALDEEGFVVLFDDKVDAAVGTGPLLALTA